MPTSTTTLTCGCCNGGPCSCGAAHCAPAPGDCWRVVVNGITGALGPPFTFFDPPDCDCLVLNGAYCLTLVPHSCDYESPSYPFCCVDSVLYNYDLLCNPDGSVSLFVPYGPPYTCAAGSWTCAGPNTFTVSGSSPYCAGWPGTITVARCGGDACKEVAFCTSTTTITSTTSTTTTTTTDTTSTTTTTTTTTTGTGSSSTSTGTNCIGQTVWQWNAAAGSWFVVESTCSGSCDCEGPAPGGGGSFDGSQTTVDCACQ